MSGSRELPDLDFEVVYDEARMSEHERLWRDGSRLRGQYLRRHLENGVLWRDLAPCVQQLSMYRVRAKNYYIMATMAPVGVKVRVKP